LPPARTALSRRWLLSSRSRDRIALGAPTRKTHFNDGRWGAVQRYQGGATACPPARRRAGPGAGPAAPATMAALS